MRRYIDEKSRGASKDKALLSIFTLLARKYRQKLSTALLQWADDQTPPIETALYRVNWFDYTLSRIYVDMSMKLWPNEDACNNFVIKWLESLPYRVKVAILSSFLDTLKEKLAERKDWKMRCENEVKTLVPQNQWNRHFSGSLFLQEAIRNVEHVERDICFLGGCIIFEICRREIIPERGVVDIILAYFM